MCQVITFESYKFMILKYIKINKMKSYSNDSSTISEIIPNYRLTLLKMQK